MDKRGWLPFAGAALLVLGCGTPIPDPWIRAKHGRVVDADTGEPIAGALAIVRYSGTERLAGEELFAYREVATTDASGRFEIPAHLSRSPWMWLWKTHGRDYVSAFHPSYGFGYRRASRDSDGSFVATLSLLDAASQIKEVERQCREWPDGETARLVCPFDADAPYADGKPRHHGGYKGEGWQKVRDGDWTFFYEDGSVAARGRYASGRELRRWEFFDRAGRRTKCIEKPPQRECVGRRCTFRFYPRFGPCRTETSRWTIIEQFVNLR